MKMIYINTNPGNADLFAPKREVDNYECWIADQYAKACGLDGDGMKFFGIAQQINMLIWAGKNGQRIRTIGIYAGALARYLENQAGQAFQVEVI